MQELGKSNLNINVKSVGLENDMSLTVNKELNFIYKFTSLVLH